MHRNPQVCILCWNHTISSVIHYVGVIPEFPKSSRCILQHILLTDLTHIFYTLWHQLSYTPEEEQMTARWQVAKTTTIDNVQLSRSTCDICDEHRDFNRCVSWRADLGRVFFLPNCWKPRQFVFKNSATAYFYTPFLKLHQRFESRFLSCFFYIRALKTPVWFPFCPLLHIRWFKQRVGRWWSKSLTFSQASEESAKIKQLKDKAKGC